MKLDAIAVCPVGDLKSVLPGGERPPAPDLAPLYAAARAAFPGTLLGGGMFSFFTELNRKRPPADELDFVMNTTCPIVHAADDRSVMETLEALPHQITTAKGYIGKTPHRVGPSAIGARDNPHGATYTPNPDNVRVCLAKMDPRMRGLFGAAWITGYVATLARSGVQAITLGAPTGPLGFIFRPTDYAQPWFDEADARVYPAYHAVSGLARARGARLVAATSSDPATVECLADTQLRGWACAEPDEEPTVTDLRPLAEWLHGRRFALDPVAALNAWNLADDVARSLGLPRVDRDRVAQRCYNKLVVANVPWLADRETYVPRWTKHEVRCLRRVLGQAAALLGRTLGV